jgi:hypothetical protein
MLYRASITMMLLFCSFLKTLHYESNEKDDGCNADGVGIYSSSDQG